MESKEVPASLPEYFWAISSLLRSVLKSFGGRVFAWVMINDHSRWSMITSMINDHWSEWWSMTDGQKSNKSKTRPPKLIKTLRSKLEIAQKYSGRLAGTFFDSIEPAFYVDYFGRSVIKTVRTWISGPFVESRPWTNMWELPHNFTKSFKRVRECHIQLGKGLEVSQTC